MTGSGDDPRAKAEDPEEERGAHPSRSSGIPPREAPQTLVPPDSDYVSGIQTRSKSLHPTVSLGQERRGSVTVSLEAQAILTTKEPAPADTRGAARLFERTLGLKANSKIMLLVSVEEEGALGAAFLSATRALELDPVVYLVDPNEGGTSIFSRRLAMQMPDVAACVAVQGSTPFAPALLEVIATQASSVLVDASTDAVARQVLRADLDELHRLGLALIERAEATSRVELSSGLAELVTVDLDRSRRPIHHGGRAERYESLVLPAGNVIFGAARAEGTIAADGGVWLDDGSVIGRGASTYLELEGGKVTRARGATADELNQLFDDDPSLRRVNSIGFGTNTSLVAGVGARALDLCLPGAYLLLGESKDPRKMVAVMPRRPGIRGGDDAWMVRGRWGRALLD
jgi:hypothetical protein